jgi:hypothetical protein
MVLRLEELYIAAVQAVNETKHLGCSMFSFNERPQYILRYEISLRLRLQAGEFEIPRTKDLEQP